MSSGVFEAARVGEQATEEGGSGFELGQTYAAGRNSKIALKSDLKTSPAEYLEGAYRVGMRRAYGVVRIGRSTYYYCSVRGDRALRQHICEFAETRFRYG